jgi:hypothetical protein
MTLRNAPSKNISFNSTAKNVEWSLVDSSSDEDEDGNPAARRTLDCDNNTTNSTKQTTTTTGILDEFHHDGEYDGHAAGRTIVEIIDDETDSLGSASLSLCSSSSRSSITL